MWGFLRGTGTFLSIYRKTQIWKDWDSSGWARKPSGFFQVRRWSREFQKLRLSSKKENAFTQPSSLPVYIQAKLSQGPGRPRLALSTVLNSRLSPLTGHHRRSQEAEKHGRLHGSDRSNLHGEEDGSWTGEWDAGRRRDKGAPEKQLRVRVPTVWRGWRRPPLF